MDEKMTKFLSSILKIEKYLVFKCDLEMLEHLEIPKIPNNVTIAEINSQNIEDVREFRRESTLQAFQQFYAKGCYGAYAYLEGVVIGHYWMEINDTEDYKLSQEGILLLPGESSTWYANVNEKYRGRRILFGLLNKLYEKANSLGFRIALIHILQDNEASIKSHRRFGGIIDENNATILRTLFRLIIIYKSNDRWFVSIRLPRSRRIVIAWSQKNRSSLMLTPV